MNIAKSAGKTDCSTYLKMKINIVSKNYGIQFSFSKWIFAELFSDWILQFNEYSTFWPLLVAFISSIMWLNNISYLTSSKTFSDLFSNNTKNVIRTILMTGKTSSKLIRFNNTWAINSVTFFQSYSWWFQDGCFQIITDDDIAN